MAAGTDAGRKVEGNKQRAERRVFVTKVSFFAGGV